MECSVSCLSYVLPFFTLTLCVTFTQWWTLHMPGANFLPCPLYNCLGPCASVDLVLQLVWCSAFSIRKLVFLARCLHFHCTLDPTNYQFWLILEIYTAPRQFTLTCSHEVEIKKLLPCKMETSECAMVCVHLCRSCYRKSVSAFPTKYLSSL